MVEFSSLASLGVQSSGKWKRVNHNPNSNDRSSFNFEVKGVSFNSNSSGTVFYKDNGGPIIAYGFNNLSIKGTDESDDIILNSCNVKNLNTKMGKDRVRAISTTFQSPVVFESNEDNRLEVSSKKSAFDGLRKWCVGLHKSDIKQLSTEECERISDMTKHANLESAGIKI